MSGYSDPHPSRSPARFPSPEMEREYEMNYPRSPERAVAQTFLRPPQTAMGNNQHLTVPRSPNMLHPQNMSLANPNFGNQNIHVPYSATSPNYHQQQQPSPCAYPRTPSPQSFPMTKTLYNDILGMALSAVVSAGSYRSALEHILKERLAERKDYDNTLKRLWIYQHLVETPCHKCCFLQGDNRLEDGKQVHKFRIKSKCLANHFRVSGNTPFNWLVRDFRRFHAPHSAGVAERKDLREIYYDEFGLFHQRMTTHEFCVLSEKLVGRPTTSGKKRTRTKSMDEGVTSLQVPPPRTTMDRGNTLPSLPITPTDFGGSAFPSVTKHEKTTTNRSRLVLEMQVANSTRLVMHGENLDVLWQKSSGPFELPTFRPELSQQYSIGRMDPTKEDQEKNEPYKLFIEDQAISRSHLQFWYDSNQGWMVMDNGSTLGTVITSTEIVEEDGEHKKMPIITALRGNEARVLQQGDIINLSDGIIQLTTVYHKFCATDVIKAEQQ